MGTTMDDHAAEHVTGLASNGNTKAKTQMTKRGVFLAPTIGTCAL